MDSYYGRLPGRPAERVQTATRTAAAADRMLRRLLPYPSAGDTLSSLAIPLRSPRGGRAPEVPAPIVAPEAAGPQAATMVSEAASILDEEMAKGVLAARGAKQTSRYGDADPSRTVVRQVHDVIDNIAAMWPSLQGASTAWPGALAPAAGGVEPSLPELKPASAVRPGQRARISMTLCNKEAQAVRLTPMATDLLGCSGGRISSQLLEIVPREIRLEAGAQGEIQIAIAVPLECVPGSYVGLLVVGGVEDLRALIAITVL